MFHEYPYSNFHELNANWLINQVKETQTKLEHVNETIKNETEKQVTELFKSGAFDTKIDELIGGVNKRLESVNYLDTLKNKKVLIIGDSNSDENWGSQLKKHWVTELREITKNIEGFSIVNKSKGGEKFSYATTILNEENTNGNTYDIIIIMLGTNDYGHATPIASFRETLRSTPYPYPKSENDIPTVFIVSPPKQLLEPTSLTARVPMTAYVRVLYSWAISRGWNFIDCWGKQPYIDVNNTTILEKYYYDKKVHFGGNYMKTFALWILSYLIGNKSDKVGEYREIITGSTLENLFTLPVFKLNSNGSYIEYSTSFVKFNILGSIINTSNYIGLRTVGYVPEWALPTDSIYYLTCEKSTVTVADAVPGYNCIIVAGTKDIRVDFTEIGQKTELVRITGQISIPQGLFTNLNQVK